MFAAGTADESLALRGEAKRSHDSGALTDAWRTALYGEGHPYVEAGYGVDATVTSMHPISVQPVDIDAFAQATAYGRLWGAVLIGAHFAGITTSELTPAAAITFGMAYRR